MPLSNPDSQIENLQSYLRYVNVKARALEDKKKSMWDEMKNIEEELAILDAEAIDTVKTLQTLVSKQIEEELI